MPKQCEDVGLISCCWLVVPPALHLPKLAVSVEDECSHGMPPSQIASPDLPTQAQNLIAGSLRRHIAAMPHRLRFHTASAARQQPPSIAIREGNQDFVFRFGRDE